MRLAELEDFTTGLAGRRLRLEAGEATYKDTETLFLPASLAHFDTREDNFRLYKSLIAHLWAQTWFGTWREWDLSRLNRFADQRLGLALFQSLEGLRLDARIAKELPGLWRETERLGRVRSFPLFGGLWPSGCGRRAPTRQAPGPWRRSWPAPASCPSRPSAIRGSFDRAGSRWSSLPAPPGSRTGSRRPWR